jgi:hypothetical protein
MSTVSAVDWTDVAKVWFADGFETICWLVLLCAEAGLHPYNQD